MLLDKLHKLVTRTWIREETTSEGRCCGHRALLLYTTHLHTGVACLDNYSYAKWVECLLDAITNLHCEALLHLKTACEALYNACNLRESSVVAIRDVGNVSLADEWEHMVLADREEFDVLDEYHLLVLLLEYC